MNTDVWEQERAQRFSHPKTSWVPAEQITFTTQICDGQKRQCSTLAKLSVIWSWLNDCSTPVAALAFWSSLIARVSPPAPQPMALLTAELWGIQMHLGFCHALRVRPTWGNKNHLSLCAERAAAGKPRKKPLTLNASRVCFILFYFGTIAAVDFINFLQHCWEI